MGAIDVAVFAVDMDGKLVLVNPAAERLVGQPSAKLLGQERAAAAAGRVPDWRDAAADRSAVRA